MLEPLFTELNQVYFAGELPIPVLIWNSRLSSSAGRFRAGSRNLLFPRAPEIEIASYLKELPDSAFHIRDTMLHEMVHYILWHRRRPYGHTPEFHEILKKVGARRYNPVPKVRAYKNWYQCISCHKLVPTRRKLKSSACLVCCKKYNRGYFSEKFKLVPTTAPLTMPNGHSTGPSPGLTTAPPPREEEQICTPPSEIVRRLEDLKRMILSKT